jgi:signal transduction histidine kinase
MLILFFPEPWIGRFMFAYYLVAAGPVIVFAAIFAVIRSIRHKDSTRTMGIGMVLICVFGLAAIYLTWTASEGASDLAILAFVSFGLFQAFGVAQRHRDSIQKERELSYRLIQSKEEMSYQRRTLESDLHDNLGSRLTDLRIRAEKAAREPGESQSFLKEIDELQSQFRQQLLFMEDLEYSAKNPIAGLQMALLRRYASAQRELNFRVDKNEIESIEDFLQNDSIRLDLFQLAREICTNDLKYGHGVSCWRVRVRSNNLQIFQCNKAARLSLKDPSHIQKRAGKLGGTVQIKSTAKYHALIARIPFSKIPQTIAKPF